MPATKAGKPVWKNNPLPGPTSLYVNSVGISGDGQSVIAGNYFFNYSATASHTPATAPLFTVGIFLWNAKGALQWKDTFQSTEGVYWVALSRDSTWAAGGGLISTGDGFIYAYNAATGAKALAYNTKVRVNRVALSGDGSYLAAGADSTYLFKRTGPSWSAPQIAPCNVGDYVVSVDISDDGQWIVAGTYKGYVLLLHNNNGVLGAPVSWQQPGGTIHWVAMAADGSGFVAGANSAHVFYFNTAGFASSHAPAWTASLTGCSRCGSVAISGNGAYVSAVGNTAKTGKVFLYSNQGSSGKQLWANATQHNPNSTSLDSAGQFVTVADGQPDGTPGTFYLFDLAGNLNWSYGTKNMSWPMQISSNATGIAAGSDDSNVYYFV
jgi:WD40 repeat protein